MNRTLRFLSLSLALLLCLGTRGVSLADDGSQAGSAADITADCAVLMPETLADKAYRITDDSIESYQEFNGKHTLEITLPQDEIAQGVYFEWYTLPRQYTLEEYNGAGELISSYENQPFVNSYYSIDDAVTRLKLVFQSDAALSTVRVYGDGVLPQNVHLWQPTLEKADLLYIASTPQAAVTDFYGVLAAYTVEYEIPSALVILAKESRTMQEGLLAGLWQMGIVSYPQFGDFAALNNDAYKRVRGSWGASATTKFIQSVLEQYDAKVVLTHTPDSQAYDAAAQYCAEIVQDVTEDAERTHIPPSRSSITPRRTAQPRWTGPCRSCGLAAQRRSQRQTKRMRKIPACAYSAKRFPPPQRLRLDIRPLGTIPAREVCLNTSIPPRSPAIRNRRQVPLLRLSRPQRQPRNRRRNPPSGPARKRSRIKPPPRPSSGICSMVRAACCCLAR
jgi:hypothetical protein